MIKSKEHGRFEVFAFRAIDEPEICKDYINGHIKVLTDFGIDNITSNNQLWTRNPDIYCLGLMSDDNELLGGIRIQIANGLYPLPVEDAIGEIDSKIYEIVEYNGMNGGVGELSGLWIDNRLRGLGTGVYMVRAAIASASQLLFKTMIGICGDVTLQMFKDVGFVVEESIGRNGTFLYPNDELIAHAVGILDAVTLNNASNHDKIIMESLRTDPLQVRLENEGKKEIKIDYNLTYPKVDKVKYVKNKQSQEQ